MAKIKLVQPLVTPLVRRIPNILSEGSGIWTIDPANEVDMVSNNYAAIFAAYNSGVSIVAVCVGDSTGVGTTRWFYKLFANKIGPLGTPNACIIYCAWDDTTQTYGAWTQIQAGALGQRYIVMDASHMVRVLGGDLVAATSADLHCRVYISPDDNTPAAQKRIIGQLGGAGNQGWYIIQNTNGTFQLSWSADGTNLLSSSQSTANAIADGTAYWLDVSLDVDNGGGGYTVVIKTSVDRGANYTTLLNQVTSAGTTSVFASTADMQVGGVSGSGKWAGKVYQVELRDGINGAIRCPVSIEAFFDDTTPRLAWGGSPTIYMYNGSMSGAGIADANNSNDPYLRKSTRVPKMLPISPVQVVFLNTGENDTSERAVGFYTCFADWLDKLQARSPNAGFIAQNQLPRNTAVTPTGDAGADSHAEQMNGLPLMLQKRGVGCVMTYAAVSKAIMRGQYTLAEAAPDGVHQSTAADDTMVDEHWRIAGQRLNA